MTQIRHNCALPVGFTLTLLLFQIPLHAQTPESDPLARLTAADLARGRQTFEAQCARCHGMQGTGGEGPDLTQPRLRHAPDAASLLRVIGEGIPGTGMPANWQISDREARQVAGYVRSLGRTSPAAVPGDPGRGREIFQGKGGCLSCHIVDGRGGSLGPELTDIGARRGTDYLRESLVDPGASVPDGYRIVRAVAEDGGEIRGMEVNEDVFTIQLKDADNRFLSFRKSALRDFREEPAASFMPRYASQLSGGEIQDLVAYLAGLRGDS